MKKYFKRVSSLCVLTLLAPSLVMGASLPIIDANGQVREIYIEETELKESKIEDEVDIPAEDFPIFTSDHLPDLPLMPVTTLPVMPDLSAITQPPMAPLPVEDRPIVHQEGQGATITAIRQGSGAQVIVLEADGPITYVDYFSLEDNRLVIDVFNSRTALQNQVGVHGAVESIRIAAHDHATRFVLDLIFMPEYVVNLSEDRTQVSVYFGLNPINIGFNHTPEADYLIIEGTAVAGVESYLQNALIVTIPTAYLLEALVIPEGFGFIDQVYWGSDGAEIQLIVITHESVSFTTLAGEAHVMVRITAPTYQNISLDRGNNLIHLYHSDEVQLTPANFQIYHAYRDLRHVFILDGDYSFHFGSGQLMFFSEHTSTIEILTYQGITYLVVNGPNIAYAELIQTEQGVSIRIFSPREVYDFIVMIDPGHGGSDPGAVHSGYRESDLVLLVSNILYEKLQKNPDIGVFTVRTEDVFVSLVDRAVLANDVADLFVSIHMNAASNAGANGTEVYYLAREDEAMHQISRRYAAEVFQRNLLADIGLADRGVRTANFAVLRHTTMPSVLVEIGFMTNAGDLAVLRNPTMHQRMAESMYRSILELAAIGR